MNSVREFCEKRKIPKGIEDAFSSYCRHKISERYAILNAKGETVTGTLAKFDDDELLKCWNEFVLEMRSTILAIGHATHKNAE